MEFWSRIRESLSFPDTYHYRKEDDVWERLPAPSSSGPGWDPVPPSSIAAAAQYLSHSMEIRVNDRAFVNTSQGWIPMGTQNMITFPGVSSEEYDRGYDVGFKEGMEKGMKMGKAFEGMNEG